MATNDYQLSLTDVLTISRVVSDFFILMSLSHSWVQLREEIART